MIDQVRDGGLTDRIVVADAAYGERDSFSGGVGETQTTLCAWVVQSNAGVWIEATAAIQGNRSRDGRPPSASHYGKQRPVAVKEAALQAKGWKKVRWREGSERLAGVAFLGGPGAAVAWISRWQRRQAKRSGS